MDEKIKKREIKTAKIIKNSSSIIYNSLISIIIMVACLVIWGLLLFIFDKYGHIAWQNKLIWDITKYCILTSFILDTSLTIISLIIMFIVSLRNKKMYKQYQSNYPNPHDVEKANIAIIAKSASSLAGNKIGVAAAGLSQTKFTINYLNNIKKEMNKVLSFYGEKTTETKIRFIPLIVTIICMITLILSTIVDGIGKKNYLEDHIISSRKETIETIKNAYKDSSYYSDLDYYVLDHDNYETFTIKYNGTNMSFELDDDGKVKTLDYYFSASTEQTDLISKFNANNIEQTIKELHSKIRYFSDVFLTPDIANNSITFSDELKEKIDQFKNEYQTYTKSVDYSTEYLTTIDNTEYRNVMTVEVYKNSVDEKYKELHFYYHILKK